MLLNEQFDDVVALVKKKNDIVNSLRDEEYNTTLLMWACALERIDVVRFLIENNCDVNCRNEYGWNALHWLALFGNDSTTRVRIFKMLADNFNIVHALNQQSDYGQTPLHNAALYNRHLLLEEMIIQGGDVNIRDKRNKRPGDHRWCDEKTKDIILRYRK